jgi:GNAT superfamily N-acetyltransferase
VRFRPVSADAPEALSLLREYAAELTGQGIVLDEREGGAVSAAEMAPPHGAFLLVERDGAAVACGGVRRLAGAAAEVKRMYVAPSARGRGVARALLGRLEDEARALRCRVARLDTGAEMPAALALYRSAGYQEIADYNGNPHAAFWMEKELYATAAGGGSRRETTREMPSPDIETP